MADASQSWVSEEVLAAACLLLARIRPSGFNRGRRSILGADYQNFKCCSGFEEG